MKNKEDESTLIKSSTILGSIFNKSDDKNEDDIYEDFKPIDANRNQTHIIYDIQEGLAVNSFSRNCTFKYKVDKNGNKIYKMKEAELKVEKYKKDKAIGEFDQESERIGYKKIDLSDFINKGLITKTYKMGKTDSLYFTVRISVITSDQTLLQAITNQANVDKEDDDDDSSSEAEIDGGKISENLKDMMDQLGNKGK